MALNIDHTDALEAIDAAYQLLIEFDRVISDQLEGDHPMASAVDKWCTWYEKGESNAQT